MPRSVEHIGRVLGSLRALGYSFGAAFQIRDDILNLIGSRERYDKEIGVDLYEGKRTLMLTHLVERSSPQEKRKLKDLLRRPSRMLKNGA
jgi:geranylgeranyl diphosphate synthase type II